MSARDAKFSALITGLDGASSYEGYGILPSNNLNSLLGTASRKMSVLILPRFMYPLLHRTEVGEDAVRSDPAHALGDGGS